MDRTERFYKIERMLRNREVVPIRDFLDELDVSKATFKCDTEYLRERLNAPIPWDREKRGYWLYDPDPENPRHELPGLWFNSSKIHALLAFHHLLDRLQSGLLTTPQYGPDVEVIAPAPLRELLRERLELTLDRYRHP